MISMERNSEKGWRGTTLNTMCSFPWPPQGWVPAWGKKRKLGGKVFEVLHERRQGKELEVVHEYHHQHGREHKMNRRPDEKNCKQRTESWIDYTQCINVHRLIIHSALIYTDWLCTPYTVKLCFHQLTSGHQSFSKALPRHYFDIAVNIVVLYFCRWKWWVSHRWKSGWVHYWSVESQKIIAVKTKLILLCQP